MKQALQNSQAQDEELKGTLKQVLGPCALLYSKIVEAEEDEGIED